MFTHTLLQTFLHKYCQVSQSGGWYKEKVHNNENVMHLCANYNRQASSVWAETNCIMNNSRFVFMGFCYCYCSLLIFSLYFSVLGCLVAWCAPLLCAACRLLFFYGVWWLKIYDIHNGCIKNKKETNKTNKTIWYDRMGANERPISTSFWLHSVFVYYIVSWQVILYIQTTQTPMSDICRFFEWIIRIGYCRWIWGFVLVFKIAHTHTSNQTEKEGNIERSISNTVFKANQNRYTERTSHRRVWTMLTQFDAIAVRNLLSMFRLLPLLLLLL